MLISSDSEEFHEGQRVQIVEGALAGYYGMIDHVDDDRRKLRVLVQFFGQETSIEVDFLTVRQS
jgi:transcriptional antiterminator NusG